MYRHVPPLFVVAVGFVLVLGLALAGCGRSPASPSPESPPGSPSSPPGSPTGSIQVAGSVSDAAWRPLAGARVEVVDGPQAGLSTTADGNGEFRLSGNFDATTHFRATKEGHVASTWPLPAACGPCNPDWWIHFSLEALAPHPNLAGDYTLTVIANSACTSVPEALRTRTFDATLTLHSGPEFPSNSRFEVSLGSPPFLDQYKSFQIGVAGDYVGGFVGDLHGTPGLAAQVATNYIALGGSVAGTVETSGATISASMDGFIDYCERPSEMGPGSGCSGGSGDTHCTSTGHQLILRRR